MVNIGDKFVIEIGGYYLPVIAGGCETCPVINDDLKEAPKQLYRVKGFNSMVLDEYALSILEKLDGDYVNENFGELQDESYKIGLQEAWDAARKLFSDWPEKCLEEVFPEEWKEGFRGLIKMDPEYAVQKIQEWERKHGKE